MHRADRHQSSVGTVVLATALVVIAAGLLVGGCGKKEPEVKEIVRPVKMMIIGAGAGSGTREYPGQVRAAEEIQLSFEVPGRIIELHAREGQATSRGALVAARRLSDWGANVEIALMRSEDSYHGAAAHQLAIAQKLKLNLNRQMMNRKMI